MMEREHKKNLPGSLSVFLAVSFFLLLCFIGAFLEYGRSHLLRQKITLISEAAAESAYSCYENKLWEEYGILGAREERILEVARTVQEDQEGKSRSVGNFHLTNLELKNTRRLTDQEGEVLGIMIRQCMTAKLPGSILEEFTEKSKGKKGTSVGGQGGEAEETDQPIEKAASLRSRPLLSLVLPSGTRASEKEIGTEWMLGKDREKGTAETLLESGYIERLAAILYSDEFLGSYTRPLEGHPLSYEKEYLIGGNGKDVKNLEEAVGRILLIREAWQYEKIKKDPVAEGKARAIASVIGGLTASPELIEGIKEGILLAWSFFRSLEDIRALLRGERVLFTGDKALDYEGHLNLILLLVPEKKLFLRIGELLGAGTGISLDKLNVEGELMMEYASEPLFERMVFLEHASLGTYKWNKICPYSYLP